MQLANAFEPVQDGRIYIEKIDGPFLFELKGTPAEYKAGLERALAKAGWSRTRAALMSASPTPERPSSPERRKEQRMCWRATRRANYVLGEKASVPTSRLYTSA